MRVIARLDARRMPVLIRVIARHCASLRVIARHCPPVIARLDARRMTVSMPVLMRVIARLDARHSSRRCPS